MIIQEIQATTLYSYRAKKTLTVSEAITACQHILEGAIGLLYSPQACTLVRLAPDGTLHDADTKEVSLTNIFEARIFNENCELRWLNELDGSGRAALVAESEISAAGFGKINTKACDALEQRYLLWGEKAKDNNTEGWQRLAEARIGKLNIPLAQTIEKEQRVYLKTLEYLAVVDDYGNVAVTEERLVRLEVA